jgi:predicted SnoaL-like aldol condensation-catalyzing enzyme
MFQMVAPSGQLPVTNQDIVVGVYSALVGENGKITSIHLPQECISAQTEVLVAIGIQPLIKFFASINRAFPRYVLNIENLVTKGEKVMAKYTILGIQTGRFLGSSPTGYYMKVTGLDIFRLNNGKVVEYWNANQKIEPER